MSSIIAHQQGSRKCKGKWKSGPSVQNIAIHDQYFAQQKEDKMIERY